MENSEISKTVIAEDVEIVGSIKCASNIHLEGKLNGDISCTGNAVIGKSATVKGNISANSATVLGQVNGNITAKDKIELKSSARITGDLRAKRLTVEDGVSFVGKSEVNASGSAPTTTKSSSEDRTKPTDDDTTKNNEADQKGKGLFGKK